MPRKSTTRRAQGEGTIRQRKDGTWEARYTLGRDPGTGKQIQKSVYGATQKDVRQKLQQISQSIDEGTYFEPTKMTVAGWMNTWLKDYLGNVKAGTVANYTRHVNNHIIPALGAMKLSALQPPQIQHLYNQLQEQGLSAKTMFSLKQSDRSAGSAPKIAVDSTHAHAVAAGFQHPLEPANVIALCAFLQVASGLHIRTRRRNFRLFGKIGNSRLVHIVQHRGRELSPFGPFAIFDARFNDTIIETSRFNRPNAVNGNSDMSAVPDDQTGCIRNRADRACLLT